MSSVNRERIAPKLAHYNRTFDAIDNLKNADISTLRELHSLFLDIDREIDESWEHPKIKKEKFWAELQSKNVKVFEKKTAFDAIYEGKLLKFIDEAKLYFGKFAASLPIESSVAGCMSKLCTVNSIANIDFNELLEQIKSYLIVSNSALFEIIKSLEPDTVVDVSTLRDNGDGIAADYFSRLALSSFAREKFKTDVAANATSVQKILGPSDSDIIAMRTDQLLLCSIQMETEPEPLPFDKAGQEISNYAGILHNNKYVVSTPYRLIRKDYLIKAKVIDELYVFVSVPIYVGLVGARLVYG
jgi:hypothetical protein